MKTLNFSELVIAGSVWTLLDTIDCSDVRHVHRRVTIINLKPTGRKHSDEKRSALHAHSVAVDHPLLPTELLKLNPLFGTHQA